MQKLFLLRIETSQDDYHYYDEYVGVFSTLERAQFAVEILYKRLHPRSSKVIIWKLEEWGLCAGKTGYFITEVEIDTNV